MVNMTDIFGNALSIAGSFMDSDLVNRFMMVIFAVILVFGVLNCILGYRLLRFWMMLGGFLVGGGLALVVVHTMGIQEKSTMLIAALAAGVVFAVIAFLIYKAGVFILAAGIGWAASIYFLHPTSSAVFFACILIQYMNVRHAAPPTLIFIFRPRSSGSLASSASGTGYLTRRSASCCPAPDSSILQ